MSWRKLFLTALALLFCAATILAQDTSRETYTTFQKAFREAKTIEDRIAMTKEFIVNNPDHPQTGYAVQSLVYTLARRENRMDDAVDFIDSILGTIRNDNARRQVQRQQAKLLGQLGDEAAIRALAASMIETGGMEYIDWLLVGRAANAAEAWDLGLKCFEEALAHSTREMIVGDAPDDPYWTPKRLERSLASHKSNSLTGKGWALINMGQVEEGLKIFKEAESYGNTTYLGIPLDKLMVYWAQVLIKQGEYDKAIEKLGPGAIFKGDEESLELMAKAYAGKTGGMDGYEDFLWQKRLELAKPIDDFTVTDYEGNPVKMSDFRGKVVLLNFWYPTCPYCLVELPRIDPILRKYKDQGFEILAIDYKASTEGALKFIKEKNLSCFFVENGKDENEVIYNIFGTTGFPTTYLVTREGRIMYLHYGFGEGNEREIEEHVVKLLEMKSE